MIYSVWRAERGVYDYYETPPAERDAFPPSPQLSHAGIGVSPERAAWSLPFGAKKTGSGRQAKGMIASTGSPLSLGGLLPDFGGTGNLVLLAVVGFFVWKYLDQIDAVTDRLKRRRQREP